MEAEMESEQRNEVTEDEDSFSFNTPKSTALCLFKIFFDQVYCPRYLDEGCDPPRMYTSDRYVDRIMPKISAIFLSVLKEGSVDIINNDLIPEEKKKLAQVFSELDSDTVTEYMLGFLEKNMISINYNQDKFPDAANMQNLDYARFGYKIYLGDRMINKNGQGEEFRVGDLFFRNLTVIDIVEYLIENKESVFRAIIGDDKYTPPATKDSIRKTLDRLKSKWKILIRTKTTTHTNNSKWFFPNESYPAFRGFIERIRPFVSQESFKKYSFLFKTRYFRICLNKQFVLETLKRTGMWLFLSFSYRISDNAGPYVYKNLSGQTVSVPLEELVSLDTVIKVPCLGRYPKKYEDLGISKEFASFIKDVAEFYQSSECNSYGDLETHFFGKTSGEKTNEPLSKDRIDLLVKVAEKLCNDLDEDYQVKQSLRKYEEYTDYVRKIGDFDIDLMREGIELDKGDLEKGTLPITDVFKADPDGTYREEDPWSGLELTDEDKVSFRESKLVIHVRTKKSPPKIEGAYVSPIASVDDELIEDHHYEKLLPGYGGTLDLIILPILSLIQFSPNALFYFVCKQDEWMKSCHAEEDNKALLPFKLIEVLTKIAIKDYLNDMSVTDARYPISCHCAGNFTIGDRAVPSVLTFLLGEKHMIALSWSDIISKDKTGMSRPVSEFISKDSKPKFQPVLINGLPHYSQRVLDIVKMSSQAQALLPFRNFLINALTDHDSEWKEYVRKKQPKK